MGFMWGRRPNRPSVEFLSEMSEETGSLSEADRREAALAEQAETDPASADEGERFRSPSGQPAAEAENTGRAAPEAKEAGWATGPDRTAAAEAVSGGPGGTGLAGCLVLKLDVDRIVPNPAQPRRAFPEEQIFSLAESIRRYGVLQPLTVRCREEGRYELVSGERRLRAARLCGLRRVPCLLLETDERTSAELALIENIQRENLTMFEEAEAMGRLIAIFDLTQEQVAARLGRSQSAVANKIRLLRFSEEEQARIVSAGLTERHARALLRIRDGELRAKTLDRVAERQLTVAQTEELVERTLEEPADEPSRQHRRFIMKDVRIFYHSIDRAVDVVRRAGIPIEAKRRSDGPYTEIVIRIPERPGGAGESPAPAAESVSAEAGVGTSAEPVLHAQNA